MGSDKKILVYTALFGDKDASPTIENWRPEMSSQYDLACITDDPTLSCEYHTVKVVKPVFSDVAKDSKFYKICGFPGIENYEVAIWHDASIILDSNKLPDLVEFSETEVLSSFKHGNTCVYEEGLDCIRLRKDNPLKIAIQLLIYALLFKHPLHNGVNENGILVINVSKYHNSPLQKKWWKHVRLFTRRDQISLPVVRRLTNSTTGILEGGGFKNPYSRYREHLRNDYKNSNPVKLPQGHTATKIAQRIIYLAQKHLSKQTSRSR